MQALQLLAVPVARGEGQRRDRHAGRLVDVHLAGRVAVFHDRVDPLHHLPRGEERVGRADRAVGPPVAAAVPPVGAAPGLGGAVQIDAVDAMLGHHPVDPLGQEILPMAAVADDVGGLRGLPLVSARAGIDQALVVIPVPLRGDVAHLVAEVEKQLDLPLVAGGDELVQLGAVRGRGIILDVGPVLVEAHGADAAGRQVVQLAAAQAVVAHVDDAVVPGVGLGRLDRASPGSRTCSQRPVDRPAAR